MNVSTTKFCLMKRRALTRSFSFRLIFGLSVLLLIAAQAHCVMAQHVEWNGNRNSNWNMPVNWSTGLVPGSAPGDTVVLSGFDVNPVVATVVETSNPCFLKVLDDASLQVCNGKLQCGGILLGAEDGRAGGHVELVSSADLAVSGNVLIGNAPGATSESGLILRSGNLMVGGEVYVGKGMIEIAGNRPGISVHDLTVASTATLRFDFDLRPASSIVVTDHLSIEEGAKLEIDLTGYTVGGNELELIRFGSVSGAFDTANVTITGLGGGIVTMDENSLNLTVLDDVADRSNTLWFIATGGSGSDALDLQINTGRRIRDLSSPDMKYVLSSDSYEKVYSASWTGSDFNGDGKNDSISFDLRVKGFSGSSFTFDSEKGSAAMTGVGSADAVEGSSEGWGVGEDSDLDAGQTLRFSVENLYSSIPGAELLGFVGLHLAEPFGGNNHTLIIGEGENLEHVTQNYAWATGFSLKETLYVTSAADSKALVNRVAVKIKVSDLPDFLDSEVGDYSHYPTGPFHRSEYPAVTNIDYPEFSWETMPMTAGVHHNETLPEWYADTMANTYPLISLGGRNYYGEDYIEAGMSAAGAVLKKYNPNVKTMTYKNAGLHHDRTAANITYDTLEWSIFNLDVNGNREYDQIRNWYRYNHDHPELRKWWSDWCVDRLNDPNIDGIFIDKATGGEEALLNDDGDIQTHENRVKSYLSIWERMPQGKVLTGNILRTDRQGGSRELLHIFNSAYSEGWKGGNSDGLVEMTTAEGISHSLQMFREAAVKGMMVSPNHANINHFILTADEAVMMIDNGKMDELIRIIQDEIQLPLAYYLIFAEPYNYFSFQIATSSSYPEIVWNPKPFVPEFKNPLGDPLGPPKQEGYIFTRSYEHVDVWLDVETEECRLTWDWMPVADPQNVELAPNKSTEITLTGSNSLGSDLGFIVTNQPMNGVLYGTAPELVYIPNTDFVGTDSFLFVTENEMAMSRKAKVTVTVGGGTLIAMNMEDLTAINTPLNIMLGGYDPNGTGNLVYSIVSPPKNGTLSDALPDITYTPNWNFIGIDSFSYRVNNGTLDSEPATVLITVSGTGSLVYSFDNPDNISGTANNMVYSAPDMNTFRTVSVSPLELADGTDGNHGRILQDGGDSPEAWVVAQDGVPVEIKFTLHIDSTLNVTFNDISFDVAYWNAYGNATTYNWKFSTVVGSKSLNLSSSEIYEHPGWFAVSSYQKFPGSGNIDLSGLSDLSNTSVTFLWQFYASKGGNFNKRRMALDNVRINGTMAAKDTTVSISAPGLTSQSVKVFPNPSGGQINVFVENSNSNIIEIVDLYGRTIYIKNDASDYMKIDLSNYPKGLYLVKVNYKSVEKVVIE